uniref:PAT complex subunit Asterix n=1 Tax=Sparus aurata TaxID=8175 RepID=A0A671TEC0_SPAAU
MMSSNNMADPRRQNKILRYKPPSTESNPTLEDPTPDYMNLLGMIFSMCGLMLKLKWCAWIAVYCSFISFANSRSSEDTKQMMSSFMLSISAVTMAARWCGPRPHPAPPPLRASTGRYAAPLPRSAAAAWAPTPPTITPSTTSGSTSTETCPFSVEAAAMGSAPAGAPCPWSPAATTPRCRSSAGGEDWWTTAMSSWLTRHTSGTTRRRPGGNSGSEYRPLFYYLK